MNVVSVEIHPREEGAYLITIMQLGWYKRQQGNDIACRHFNVGVGLAVGLNRRFLRRDQQCMSMSLLNGVKECEEMPGVNDALRIVFKNKTLQLAG